MTVRRSGLLLLLAGLLIGPPLQADPIRVGSFNIHYLSPNQDDMAWSVRRQAVRRVVGAMDADILAFQEMETFVGGDANDENRQLDWVLRHYPEYGAGAVGDAEHFPVTQPILFRHERFQLLDQGWFFYSETPDVIYSRTFNGSYPAFTSWVELRDRATGRTMRVVNNHFDYASASNRRRSARLVAERIAPILDHDRPLILLGDFNAPSFWPPMGFLRDQGLTLVDPSGSTFHHNRGWELIPAIDHILVSAGFRVLGEIERFTQSYDGVYPGDHYPILAEVEFR